MGFYCQRMRTECEWANLNGHCVSSVCKKSAAWNNAHSLDAGGNLKTPPKREDGIYAQFFAIKDGERYDTNVINLKEISSILTNSLMDGIEKLFK